MTTPTVAIRRYQDPTASTMMKIEFLKNFCSSTPNQVSHIPERCNWPNFCSSTPNQVRHSPERCNSWRTFAQVHETRYVLGWDSPISTIKVLKGSIVVHRMIIQLPHTPVGWNIQHTSGRGVFSPRNLSRDRWIGGLVRFSKYSSEVCALQLTYPYLT